MIRTRIFSKVYKGCGRNNPNSNRFCQYEPALNRTSQIQPAPTFEVPPNGNYKPAIDKTTPFWTPFGGVGHGQNFRSPVET